MGEGGAVKLLTYSAIGSVRGSCGHKHRSLEAAVACLCRDQRRMTALPGRCYSDREIERSDGRRLDDDDVDYINDLMDGRA